MQDINTALADKKIQNVISYNVRKFGWAFDSLDDARQEAYLCLLEILKKHDEKRGSQLPSYLGVCLRHKFMGFCKEKNKLKKIEFDENLDKIHVTEFTDYSYERLDEYSFLSQKQKDILHSYFYERKFLREIAEEYQISIEWARMTIQKALLVIRENFFGLSVEITNPSV